MKATKVNQRATIIYISIFIFYLSCFIRSKLVFYLSIVMLLLSCIKLLIIIPYRIRNSLENIVLKINSYSVAKNRLLIIFGTSIILIIGYSIFTDITHKSYIGSSLETIFFDYSILFYIIIVFFLLIFRFITLSVPTYVSEDGLLIGTFDFIKWDNIEYIAKIEDKNIVYEVHSLVKIPITLCEKEEEDFINILKSKNVRIVDTTIY